MAKYGFEKRDFQLGDFWLGQRSSSPAWHRCWFDPDTRQTRRASLGTTDFEEAKELLTDWFVKNHTPQQEEAADVLLAEILARYWEQHAKSIRSSVQAKSSLNYWLKFYEDATLSQLKNVKLQEQFHAWLLAKGMKAISVNRIISDGRAAINRAWKRGEVESVPFILSAGGNDRKNSPAKGRPLEVEEIALLFENFQKVNIKVFTIFMLATAARPEAIFQLSCAKCDIKNKLIDLNPTGRMQNNKHRPIVRMPESIMPLAQKIKEELRQEFIIEAEGFPIKSLRTAWRTAREHAELQDRVNPYSLRHTMARWLRKQGVPIWEISAQLGHKQREMTITEVYAPHDPSYLLNSTKSIDNFFDQLRASR